jgi:hypothetical protein
MAAPGGLNAPQCHEINPPTSLPPPAPPPTAGDTRSLDLGDSTTPFDCPPGCLIDSLCQTTSPITVGVDLRTATPETPDLADLSLLPPHLDSVTHVVCSPRICGLHRDHWSSITLKHNCMIDGGSNVCVTGDLNSLLDAVDIAPITISVALEGTPSSYDDCITKQGLLPLTLSNGSTYYQTCYYCANMVETIISPAAVLASSNVFSQWTQDGFKDTSLPGTF